MRFGASEKSPRQLFKELHVARKVRGFCHMAAAVGLRSADCQQAEDER
jgi:hypothetical protein